MALDDNERAALVAALKGSIGGGAPTAMSGAALLAKSAADAHRKNNPTLYAKNGAFDWQKANAPNQGWNTTATPAPVAPMHGAMHDQGGPGAAPGGPVAPMRGSIYGPDAAPQPPAPGVQAPGGQTPGGPAPVPHDPWSRVNNMGG